MTDVDGVDLSPGDAVIVTVSSHPRRGVVIRAGKTKLYIKYIEPRMHWNGGGYVNTNEIVYRYKFGSAMIKISDPVPDLLKDWTVPVKEVVLGEELIPVIPDE